MLGIVRTMKIEKLKKIEKFLFGAVKRETFTFKTLGLIVQTAKVYLNLPGTIKSSNKLFQRFL